MSTIDDGGPAFPGGYPPPETPDAPAPVGLSLRDWFAGQAINSMRGVAGSSDDTIEWAATESYKLADAMLKARNTKFEETP